MSHSNEASSFSNSILKIAFPPASKPNGFQTEKAPLPEEWRKAANKLVLFDIGSGILGILISPILIAISIILFAFGIVTSILERAISGPLSQIKRGIQCMAQGQLSQRLAPDVGEIFINEVLFKYRSGNPHIKNIYSILSPMLDQQTLNNILLFFVDEDALWKDIAELAGDIVFPSAQYCALQSCYPDEIRGKVHLTEGDFTKVDVQEKFTLKASAIRSVKYG